MSDNEMEGIRRRVDDISSWDDVKRELHELWLAVKNIEKIAEMLPRIPKAMKRAAEILEDG